MLHGCHLGTRGIPLFLNGRINVWNVPLPLYFYYSFYINDNDFWVWSKFSNSIHYITCRNLSSQINLLESELKKTLNIPRKVPIIKICSRLVTIFFSNQARLYYTKITLHAIICRLLTCFSYFIHYRTTTTTLIQYFVLVFKAIMRIVL